MDRMAANKKPIAELTPDELDLGADALAAERRVELEQVTVPDVRSECELIEGEGAGDVAARLLDRLEELRLLSGSRA